MKLKFIVVGKVISQTSIKRQGETVTFKGLPLSIWQQDQNTRQKVLASILKCFKV